METHQELSILTRAGEVELVVQQVAAGILVNCEDRHGIPEGAVLIRNWEQGEDGHPKFMSFDDGIFAALRSQGRHVPDGYDRELGQVEMLQGSLAWALEAAWDLHNANEEQRKEYARTLMRVSKELKAARDERKVEVHDRARRASDPIDSLGRFNPMSRCPIIWSSSDLLDERIDVTDFIRGAIDTRKFRMVAFLDDVRELRKRIERHITFLFSEHKREKLTSRRIDNAIAHFDDLEQQLRNTHVAPFGPRSFRKSADDLQAAVQALSKHGLENGNVKQPFDRVRRAMRLLYFHRRLQEILVIVSVSRHNDIPVDEHDIEVLCGQITWLQEKLNASKLDTDFERPIVADVTSELEEAPAQALEDASDLNEVYQPLKRAASHF